LRVAAEATSALNRLTSSLSCGRQTIAELAEEKSVALGGIVDAFVASHARMAGERRQIRSLTQEQADLRLER
jgi:hypothetical protein